MTDSAELEEERRLAYVGITRARRRLYLTHAWSRSLFGGSNFNPPSRFLGEIPPHLVRELEKEPAASEGRVVGAPPERSARDPIPVAEGDTVYHEKWGEGVVVAVSGTGPRAEATVSFSEVGEKQLLLAYAPLVKHGREG